MSTDIYKEAIADAHKLKQMAEQAAKNKIIDAVTPQIKDLIERQLMAEQDIDLPDGDELVLDMGASEDDDLELDDAGAHLQIDPGAKVDIEVKADGSVELETDQVELVLGADGEGMSVDPVAADMMDVVPDSPEDDEPVEDGDVELAVAEAISRLIDRRISETSSPKLSKRLRNLSRGVKLLKNLKESAHSSTDKTKIAKAYLLLIKEAAKTRDYVILTEQNKGTKVLSDDLQTIVEELKQMSRRGSDIFSFLFETSKDETYKEQDEALEEAELNVILDDPEAEALAGAEEPDAVRDELETILADIEVALDVGEAEEGDEGEEDVEGEEGEEMEMEPMEDEEMEETDEMAYEIDESALRRELHRMRRLSEQDEPADADPYVNNGGEDEGDAFVEVDEDTLLNALADELGDAPMPSVGGNGAAAVAEARLRRRIRRRIAEAKRRSSRTRRTSRNSGGRSNRVLKEQLTQYKRAVGALKGQLTEMNLFNAKLLYANKLMQNRDLSTKQQRAIVEALDNAKTLREAKLLYGSLTETLNKRARRGLSEGRSYRTLGSSSRSTQSANPAKSGVEVDRWAVLAGLNKDN